MQDKYIISNIIMFNEKVALDTFGKVWLCSLPIKTRFYSNLAIEINKSNFRIWQSRSKIQQRRKKFLMNFILK